MPQVESGDGFIRNMRQGIVGSQTHPGWWRGLSGAVTRAVHGVDLEAHQPEFEHVAIEQRRPLAHADALAVQRTDP